MNPSNHGCAGTLEMGIQEIEMLLTQACTMVAIKKFNLIFFGNMYFDGRHLKGFTDSILRSPRLQMRSKKNSQKIV